MVVRAHPPLPGPARRAGFTLIETMVVLALLAILASLAGPAMSRFVATQRVKSSASSLHLSLVKARSEAIKRNATVSVQPITGADWSTGWNVVSGTTVLDVTSANGQVAVTTTPSGLGMVSFRADGRSGTGAIEFDLGSAQATSSRCVSIDAAGRPYVKEGTTCS
jgi:type IV fimbrial biogenesis protein FimT